MDWSYHWVIWKDIDDDGLLDAFTARFRVPGVLEGGDPISQLVWFKNPGGEAPSSGHTWAWQHFIILTGGPDVYFEETLHEVCNPDCKEYSVIVTGELWNERIMLYYVENAPAVEGGETLTTYRVSWWMQSPDNLSRQSSVTSTMMESLRSLRAPTTQGRAMRQETSGSTRNRTVVSGRGQHWLL